ncbi:MAG: hypothetical protein KAS71_03975 [Bacteroidales bacterium]|nr:hypothetical protein [Bacteroidales bacterium]
MKNIKQISKKFKYSILLLLALIIMALLIWSEKMKFSGAFGGFILFVAAIRSKMDRKASRKNKVISEMKDKEKEREEVEDEFEERNEELERSMKTIKKSTDSLKKDIEENEQEFVNKRFSEEEILERLKNL